MSHYTVTVKVPQAKIDELVRLGSSFNDAVEQIIGDMLEPYEEQTVDPKYLTFDDTEDEGRKEYETGTDGDGKSFKKRYKTFESFMENWHGYERDPDHGNRYGRTHNVNAKWDWWIIGGRWTGYYPIRAGATSFIGNPGLMTEAAEPGRSDGAYLKDIDGDKVATSSAKEADGFFTQYTNWLKKPIGSFDSPREWAMDLGLVRVVEGPVSPNDLKEGEVVIPWTNYSIGDERAKWNDIARSLTREEFEREFADLFDDRVTYAALDEKGWHEPGRMGWFGVSLTNPENRNKFRREFVDRFLKNHDDFLVVVDCHI